MLQEICKYRMRMHRHVSEDIMKNVRLGNIGQRIAASQPGRCWKHARFEHFKKRVAGKESADCRGTPASPGLEPLRYLAKIWQTIVAQPDDAVALQVLAARVFLYLRKPPAHQFGPNGVLLRLIIFVFL